MRGDVVTRFVVRGSHPPLKLVETVRLSDRDVNTLRCAAVLGVAFSPRKGRGMAATTEDGRVVLLREGGRKGRRQLSVGAAGGHQ